MVMEGRDQQSVDLNHDTHAIHSNGKREHLWNKSGQLDMFPNRWLRISFAARKRETRFDNVLCHIKVDSLRVAFEALEPSKALGIDGVSKSAYARDLEANLRDLEDRIHKGSYKPQPKREVLIPKANGKRRPIAISCLEDKIVEAVVAKVLEAAYEPIFIQNSFGFRPNKSAHDAIKEIYQTLKDQKRPHVVEIDFANCFGSIPHRKLIKVLTQRITDRRFKGLIGRFLKVGILDQTGKTVFPTQGIPQGSIMSPVLANIYLHDVLDKWFIENYASHSGVIVRYADDAVFFFKSEEEAQQFVLQLDQRVRSFGLELNMDKTRIIKFDKDEENELEFLGLSLYYGKDGRGRRLINLKTMQKTLHRKIQEFYQWIKAVRSKFKLSTIWQQAKAKLSGHYNYFGYDTNASKLQQFYFEATRSLFKWLNRRSQLRSFSWKKFQRKLKHDPLPLPPVKAYLRQLRRNVFHIQANRWLRSPVREIRMRGSVGVLPPSLAFCNSMEER